MYSVIASFLGTLFGSRELTISYRCFGFFRGGRLSFARMTSARARIRSAYALIIAAMLVPTASPKPPTAVITCAVSLGPVSAAARFQGPSA